MFLHSVDLRTIAGSGLSAVIATGQKTNEGASGRSGVSFRDDCLNQISSCEPNEGSSALSKDVHSEYQELHPLDKAAPILPFLNGIIGI